MLNSERGIAAVIAILMVGMLTILGLAALSTSDDEVSIAGNELQATRAFYAAEAGLESAAAAVQHDYEATGLAPTVMPSGTQSLNGCDVTYTTTDLGPAVAKKLATGSLAGLNALVKTYEITSTAVSTADSALSSLNTRFEADLVPIFQFAVFYDDDLQTQPAELMTVTGRVHVNGSMWLQAAVGLRFDGRVTTAGGIYHGLKYTGASQSGNVFFKNSVGLYQGMKVGSSWLDCTSSNWYAEASARWNGLVRDKAFGQEKLNLPLAGGDPHNLIERGMSNPDSYEHKAALKFIDDKVYKKVGSAWVDVTVDMTTKGIIARTTNKFKDSRESKTVDVTDLDVAKLYSEGYEPSNGVIFFSDKTAGLDYPALRLKNATQLGAGLTIAAENPVYSQGHLNTINKKPMAILTDAYTILSGNWDDAKSTMSTSSRVAANTTVNVSFVTGDKKETPSAPYHGGLANLPRFMESWGATRTCTIRGSMVNLWNSVQSTGDWSLSYYDPPARDYGFDIDLNDPSKLPPATPSVLTFTRAGWSEQHVANIE